MIAQQIKQAINDYHSTICDDHHKDRDCHFHIESSYVKYEDKPSFCAYHAGYMHEFNRSADSYEEAQKELLLGISGIIVDQVDWIINARGTAEYDYENKLPQEQLLNLLEKYNVAD